MIETPIRVAIVDDSIVVRGIVSRLLRAEPDIDVVSAAIDGVMAIEHAAQFRPDIMILDIEMPNKDGMSALPDILKASPSTKVVMASTLTKRNAAISMKALELGASDYLQKPSAGERGEMDRFSRELLLKIRALAGRTVMTESRGNKETAPVSFTPATPAITTSVTEQKNITPVGGMYYPSVTPRALAIASSTGGPQALTTIFRELKGKLNDIPIFITQHMPPAFTTILATNLESVSQKPCREAYHNETVTAGTTYIAPGDFHMTFVKQGTEIKAMLNQGNLVNYCRPSADPMIESLVEIYYDRLMLLVLTGMGQDGLAGARLVRSTGGCVIAQNKESSVVWGMPKAVAEAGLASTILPLSTIADYLKKVFGGDR